MTLRRLLALAWCASAASLAAQTPFHGTVLSKRDGQPIVAAEVGTVDGRVHAWTDEGGRFVLLAGAGDSVRIHAVGHAEWRGQLAAGDTVFALEPYTAVLAAVTTTAGQRSIRTSESTASVTVIGRADLDAAAAIGVDQALRRVPGLQELASPPSKSTVSIRGLDAAHVLVLVDGEPVPGGLIDTRDIGRLSSVAAERIEVTKGPSSVEFGSDALGGVINLITARPSPSFSLDATARAGELGRKESTLDLSSTVGKFGYRLSGGWRQLDRLVAVDASGTSLDRVYDVRTDTRYRASDALMLRGDMQLSQERQRWPVGGGYNGFIDNHAAQGLFEARYLGWGGIVRARVFGQYYDYEYRQSQQLLPIEGSADSLQQTEHLLRGMVSYARAVGAHTLDFGAQLSARSIVAPQKISGNRASDDVTEVFARDAWSPGPFLVTAGGRVTNSTLWGGRLPRRLAWRGRCRRSSGFARTRPVGSARRASRRSGTRSRIRRPGM